MLMLQYVFEAAITQSLDRKGQSLSRKNKHITGIRIRITRLSQLNRESLNYIVLKGKGHHQYRVKRKRTPSISC